MLSSTQKVESTKHKLKGGYYYSYVILLVLSHFGKFPNFIDFKYITISEVLDLFTLTGYEIEKDLKERTKRNLFLDSLSSS